MEPGNSETCTSIMVKYRQMKVLKGLGAGILGFFLFLSLSVFALAFTMHTTVLNPDFVATQVDRADLPALARELNRGTD